MKQRRIKKLVKQHLNAKQANGQPLYADRDAKLTRAAAMKELTEEQLLVTLLDPDADKLASDAQAQAEASKAGIADATIRTAAGQTEKELETDAIHPDTDGDGALDGDDAFPKDPAEQVDADGDGVGANADADDNDPLVS